MACTMVISIAQVNCCSETRTTEGSAHQLYSSCIVLSSMLAETAWTSPSGFRFVSCSFPIKCYHISSVGFPPLTSRIHTFTLVITPWLCTPCTVSYANCPDKYGSVAKPSQFRPPRAVLPSGPTTGPSMMLLPLRLNSPAMPTARWCASSRFHDAPTDQPEAHAVTKSVDRRPLPASERQRPGKLTRGIAAMTPEQPLAVFETPPVRTTWIVDQRGCVGEIAKVPQTRC